MTAVHLRTAFAFAVATALAANVSACSSGETTSLDGVGTPPRNCKSTAADRKAFAGIHGTERAFQDLANIEVAQPFDYLELGASVYGSDAGADTGPVSTFSRAKLGAPCKAASNVAGCQKLLEGAVRRTSLFSPPKELTSPSATYLVLQAGDEVRTIATRSELLAFLGPIRSPEAARLVVEAEGYRTVFGDAAVVTNDRGYTVMAIGPGTIEAGDFVEGLWLEVSRAGEVSVQRSVSICDPEKEFVMGGRRPEGYRAPTAPGELAFLEYLALMHDLEAASVPAFLRLAEELGAHGASTSLCTRAEEAARDEVRHAAGFARLRGLNGVTAPPPVIPEGPRHVRELEALAIENAVEGCVRETFGALVATYQSAVAADIPVRSLLACIAEDETRHAELAWDVAAWLDAQLDTEARRRVEAARAIAIEQLAHAIATARPNAELVRRCGIPTGAESQALVAACRQLWAG